MKRKESIVTSENENIKNLREQGKYIATIWKFSMGHCKQLLMVTSSDIVVYGEVRELLRLFPDDPQRKMIIPQLQNNKNTETHKNHQTLSKSKTGY